MRIVRGLTSGVAAAWLCAAVVSGAAWGQQGGTGSTGLPGSAPSGRAGQIAPPSPSVPSLIDDTNSDGPGSIEAQQARLRNMDRQKELVSDTQKLVALANELKADVDKSTKDTLSLDVVRKADEIEKLAHNVKEKMKGQ